MKIDKTIRNVAIYASFFVILLVILLIFPFIDNALILQLSNIQNPILNPIMVWVSNIGSGIVVFFIVTTLFLYEKRKRKWIIPLWLGFALSTFIVFALKLLILKERPFMVLELFAFKEFAFWNSSFPSWHAAMAFSALPVIDKEFRKIRIIWILFALLILFSRVYFSYHFFSDIIAGALIGYFSGFIFVRLWEKKIKTKK
ncbi:MAG: phosphatase PAP2 family protein [Nanoarchaeota archaeon]|nr:phosphatase PAP2 family protein [Nanoarchaeota archaeon]